MITNKFSRGINDMSYQCLTSVLGQFQGIIIPLTSCISVYTQSPTSKIKQSSNQMIKTRPHNLNCYCCSACCISTNKFKWSLENVPTSQNLSSALLVFWSNNCPLGLMYVSIQVLLIQVVINNINNIDYMLQNPPTQHYQLQII